MRSLVALAHFYFLMACLGLVTGLSLWQDGPACSLLLYLATLCAIARVIMECLFEQVRATPLIPRLALAARLRLLRAVKLPHLARVAIFGAVATLIFCCLPWVLRHTIMPTAGGFTPDNIGAAALGAFQYFAALSLAYVSWRGLFPSLYAYAAETMEGKLLESITKELLALLPGTDSVGAGEWWQTKIAHSAERRKIATFQFTVRCVRFVFSVSPFVFFFVQANHALASALTVVPPAALGL
jgi:hypothetical protein